MQEITEYQHFQGLKLFKVTRKSGLIEYTINSVPVDYWSLILEDNKISLEIIPGKNKDLLFQPYK